MKRIVLVLILVLLVAGSIEGDVKQKHLPAGTGKKISATSSPFPLPHVEEVFLFVASATSVSHFIPAVRFLSPASRTCGRCQPWFYLRLAPERGTIALLGYPRGHMVARETGAAARLNQPKILTLEPER